jgi:hypothetical protein
MSDAHPRVFTALAAAICVALSVSTAGQELPLRAHVVSIDADSAEYAVKNESAKAATAWSVELVTTDSLGATHLSGIGQDMYITAALREIDPHTEPKWLNPQATRVLEMSGGVSTGATLVRVDPRVVAVIFEDGTSAGDPAIVQRFFDARRAQRDTYAAMLLLLRSALANVSRPVDVAALVQAVTSHRHSKSDAGVVESLLQNLRTLQHKIGTGRVDPRLELQNLERMMTLEHAAAVKHAEPFNVSAVPRK